jgi:hypothetical protein
MIKLPICLKLLKIKCTVCYSSVIISHYTEHLFACNLCKYETLHNIQMFQLRLSPSKAEKSNTSAEGFWESLKNSLIFRDSQQAFALVFEFSTFLGDDLNWNRCMHGWTYRNSIKDVQRKPSLTSHWNAYYEIVYAYMLSCSEYMWYVYILIHICNILASIRLSLIPINIQ